MKLRGSKAAYAIAGSLVLVLIASLAAAFGPWWGAAVPRVDAERPEDGTSEEGPRLAGRTGPAPDTMQASEASRPERRIWGRVVLVEGNGTSSPADAEVVVSFQGYRHRRGYTTTWIAGREKAPTGEDGAFDLGFPDTDEHIRSVFLSVNPPDGWIAPIDFKLEDGRVYVPVEIPSRIYDHRPWISLPPPDGRQWSRDPSNWWAIPEIRLEPAATVSGQAFDPWGGRLVGVLVACEWVYRDLGLARRLQLTDEQGRFSFEVPASAPEVHLTLNLRPTWDDVSALAPPRPPRKEPDAPEPPSDASEGPRPARHPWPGTPQAWVRPGARGVVLQANEGVVVEGRVVTEDGRPPAEGEFYVRPLAPTQWPIGYDHGVERSFESELGEDGTFTLRGLTAGSWIVAFREHVEVAYMKTEPPPLTGHVVVEAPSTGVRLVCRPAVWIDVTADAEDTDEQWLTPLVTPAPDDWWETGAVAPLGRFLPADDAMRRSGRISTQAWNWLENAPGVLYVASKDGRQALLRDVDPSTGEIQVTLEPGGTIRGTIADFHTLGFLENGLREYTPDVWVVARRGHLVRKGWVLEGGAFEINALPPGRWDVALQGEHIYEKNPRARRAGVPTGTEDLVLRVR